MANSRQAIKRIHQAEKRNVINNDRRSRIRTFIKKVESAITLGDVAQAKDAFKVAMPEMQRGVTKGVLHRNTVARKLSRLSARIKTLDLAKAS